eukprot:gene11595-21833_t
MSSSLARTFSSPFNSKVAQGARKFMSLQASNASKVFTNEIQELFKMFLVPIKVGGLVPKAAIEAIFGNIEGICSVNIQLLELMEADDVATALYKLAPFMKLYSLYANNFERSNKTIEEQEKKNPDFVAFKELQENKDEMNGLKLRALLITPIQRIPRYKLLLDTLLEKTTPDHPDYQKLRDACAEVSKVATHINECLRLHENFNKMLSIQNSLVGDGAPRILAPDSAALIHSPPRHLMNIQILLRILKVCERGGSKDRMFFLFNDILIYAKKESLSTYSCRGVFPLINCMIEQVMGGTRGPSEGGALFKVICKGKTLLLYSTSKQNARSWVRDIKNAISELHTNLASLRRGDTDPFTPPDAAFKRDSKMRRSKGAKELLKKNNPMSPIQRLQSYVSPRQDILYPMRKDILPQLTDTASQPNFMVYEEKTNLLQSCLSSAKKDNSMKPRLRRLHLDDSYSKTSTLANPTRELRKRGHKEMDASSGNCKSPVRFSTANDAELDSNINQRLIDTRKQAKRQALSPGCFGSAKKARSLQEEAYGLDSVAPPESLFEKENELHGDLQRTNDPSEFSVNKPDLKVEVQHLKATSNKEVNTVSKAGKGVDVGSKIWSLTDDNEISKKRKKKGAIYQAKSKVSKLRRRNRRLSTSRPYQKSTSCSDEPMLSDNNENSSLLVGTKGKFKKINTPVGDQRNLSSERTESGSSSCIIM